MLENNISIYDLVCGCVENGSASCFKHHLVRGSQEALLHKLPERYIFEESERKVESSKTDETIE